jgi:hypothetical protein
MIQSLLLIYHSYAGGVEILTAREYPFLQVDDGLAPYSYTTAIGVNSKIAVE